MKRTVIFSIILILTLTSCKTESKPSYYQWKYNLPNNYAIIGINQSQAVAVRFLYPQVDSNVFADAATNTIEQFCFNDRYVCLIESNDETPENVYMNGSSYDLPISGSIQGIRYDIIDTLSQKMYGPLGENAFLQMCSSLKIGNLGKWVKTNPKPMGNGVSEISTSSSAPVLKTAIKGNLICKDENGNVVLQNSDFVRAEVETDPLIDPTSNNNTQMTIYLTQRGSINLFYLANNPGSGSNFTFYINGEKIGLQNNGFSQNYSYIWLGDFTKSQAQVLCDKINKGH